MEPSMVSVIISCILLGCQLNSIHASPVNKSPEDSLRFVRHVFASNGALNTVMRDRLHQRNRRRSSVFHDGAQDIVDPNSVGQPKTPYGNFVGNLLTLIRKRKYGDPVRVDLPSLGLCNRRTCGELYKYLDEFRNSDFFINMQTFFSLLQDQDGLNLILDVLRDPKLLQEISSSGLLGGGGGPKSGGRPPPKISSSIDAPPDTLDFDLSNYDYDNYGPPDNEETQTKTVEETVRIPDSRVPNANSGTQVPGQVPNRPVSAPVVPSRGSKTLGSRTINPTPPPRSGVRRPRPPLPRPRPRINFPPPGVHRPLPPPRTTTPGYRRQDDPYYVMYFN